MPELELYSAQDVETKVVVPHLRDLGYVEEDDTRNVVLRLQHPITVQHGREQKTIYADVVVFLRGAAVMVIDSKNPRDYLTENDREQVISYARLIGDIAPYAALCNGRTWQYFDTITKEQIAGLPSYEQLRGAEPAPPLTDSQRSTLVRQATRVLLAIDSARELSRLVRQCHDVIRNLRGLDPTSAFDELSKVLFCKMFEEREVAEGRRGISRFSLSVVQQMRRDGVDILDAIWRDTIDSDRYRDVFSDSELDRNIDLPPEAVDRIVEILQDRSLALTDLDVKGVAFEEFLAATYRGGGLGQYFTPREIVSFMVDLADPAIGESIIDPACGTGGFLIRSYDVVHAKIMRSELSDEEKQAQSDRLANSSLVGIDWEPRAARTCKMNMIIHGDGHAGVYQANALDLAEVRDKVVERRRTTPEAPAIEEGTFDVVLTNPPFGAKDRVPRILRYYDLGGATGQKREVLLLERCIRLLRPGGRLVTVIPEGILSNYTDSRIREYIREHCTIRAVVRLPQDAFKMSEGAACTSILYAVKKDGNQPDLVAQGPVFFARAEHIGISPSGRPIERNDLPTIRENYRIFEQGNWRGLELEEVAEDCAQSARDVPCQGDPWLEPEVNRTSLLYDNLCYVLSSPILADRFSYTYYHPRYFRVMATLDQMSDDVQVHSLVDLCQRPYPRRGKSPGEQSSEGISVIKVRNVTGSGIDLDTDYAPDTPEVLGSCSRALVSSGDVLVTCTGEGTIGRVDVYSFEEPSIADGHVAICRLRDGVNAHYVAEFLRSEFGQVQMLRYVSGSTGQTELLTRYLRLVRIPLPEPELQEEVVRMVLAAREEAQGLLLESQQTRVESARLISMAQTRMYQMIRGTTE
jgi:type I restriction-modification system DNA methylase subunit